MNNSHPKLPNCYYEEEQIHIPGYIQPHGAIFALQIPDLTILQVSENTEQILGIAADVLLGKNIRYLLST